MKKDHTRLKKVVRGIYREGIGHGIALGIFIGWMVIYSLLLILSCAYD